MINSAWGSLKDLLNTDERCNKPSCTEGIQARSSVYPPDRSQIGRANWRYVHARAASYPDSPPLEVQMKEADWVKAFTVTYPCKICARDFVSICERTPPVVLSKNIYEKWWIQVHNEVNRDLAKPLFKT